MTTLSVMVTVLEVPWWIRSKEYHRNLTIHMNSHERFYCGELNPLWSGDKREKQAQRNTETENQSKRRDRTGCNGGNLLKGYSTYT